MWAFLAVVPPTTQPSVSLTTSRGTRAADLAQQFPEQVTGVGCHSWLMDDQLADYRPDASNLIRFHVVTHLRSGHHWHNQTGWIPIR